MKLIGLLAPDSADLSKVLDQVPVGVLVASESDIAYVSMAAADGSAAIGMTMAAALSHALSTLPHAHPLLEGTDLSAIKMVTNRRGTPSESDARG